MRSCVRFAIVGIVSLTFATLGCRGRQGDGGGDGNGTTELTAEQQAAVDAVVEQLEATAKAVGGLVDSFSGLDADGDVTAGECPVVTASFGEGVTNVTVDFGETGCTSDYYDNDTVSGSVALTLDRIARTVGVVFNNLSVDGATTSGTADFTLTRDGDRRTLAGTIDIATSGVGSVVGTLSVRIDVSALTIAVDEADLTVFDESTGDTYSVDVDGIVIDPLGNGNFIPESGTVTFEIPNDGPGPETITIVIEFDANSPVDGTVAVTVGEAEPVEYELPTL